MLYLDNGELKITINYFGKNFVFFLDLFSNNNYCNRHVNNEL